MVVRLPSDPDCITERLAALEDPLLAERLFAEHATLYTEEPPRTERAVLAWAMRRFGTVALALTGAASIAAGYLWAQSLPHHAGAPPVPAHRAAAQHAVPAPQHRPPQRAQHAAVHHPAVAVHRAAAMDARAVLAPLPNRTSEELRARIAAQEAQLRALQQRVAREEAAARAVHARAIAAAAPSHVAAPAHVHVAAPAHRTAPAHVAAPAAEPATATATASEVTPKTATATSVSPATKTATATASETAGQIASSEGPTNIPGDGPVATGGGTKPPPQPPANPRGGWSEHIPAGAIVLVGSVLRGGPIDPCTPPGGRVGSVLGNILGRSGGRF